MLGSVKQRYHFEALGIHGDNIKVDIWALRCESVSLIQVAQVGTSNVLL